MPAFNALRSAYKYGRGRPWTSLTIRPTWRIGAPVNAWIPIPGTAGCGGASVDPWGGFPIRDDADGLVQIVFLAAGGHGNSYDNRVVSCDLSADSPSWTMRVTPSLIPYNAQAGNLATTRSNYYSWDVTPGDNPKPGSSHCYDYFVWSRYVRKYIRTGATGVYSNGDATQCMDSIAPVDVGGGIWQWDPPGTNPLFIYTDNSASQARGNPGDGYIWAAGYRWRPGMTAWETQTIYNYPYTDHARFPAAYDTSRDSIFNLQYGDGQDRGASIDALLAKQTFLSLASSRAISFNAGTALTKLLTDKPDYAGMDYNPDDDYFLFMYDRNDAIQLQGLFKIVPNPTATWDLSIFTPAGGGVTPGRTPTDGSGVNGRLKYSTSLKGWIYISKGSDGAYFMATR